MQILFLKECSNCCFIVIRLGFYPFNRDICDGSSLRTENDHRNPSFLFDYEVFEFMCVGVFFVLKMTTLMMIHWLWVCAFCAFVQLRRLSLLRRYLLYVLLRLGHFRSCAICSRDSGSMFKSFKGTFIAFLLVTLGALSHLKFSIEDLLW